MTRSEALKEARRRWGIHLARLTRHRSGTHPKQIILRCGGDCAHCLSIGNGVRVGSCRHEVGRGMTWEAAFADADARAARSPS